MNPCSGLRPGLRSPEARCLSCWDFHLVLTIFTSISVRTPLPLGDTLVASVINFEFESPPRDRALPRPNVFELVIFRRHQQKVTLLNA